MPTLSDRQATMAGNSPFVAVHEGRVWDAFLDAGTIAAGASAFMQLLPDSEWFFLPGVSTLSPATTINIFENGTSTPGAPVVFGNRNFKVAPNIPAPVQTVTAFTGGVLRYTTALLGADGQGNASNALVGGSSQTPFLLPKGGDFTFEIVNNDAASHAFVVDVSIIQVNAPIFS